MTSKNIGTAALCPTHTTAWVMSVLCAKLSTDIAAVLTSMGLTGVDGRGCRYSGCKMCPARAVSIFKIFMGRRLA